MDEHGENVYKSTTTPAEKKKGCSSSLDTINTALKGAQLVFSLVAFICEEIIEHCENCGGLYFFEFVSCSASLLVLLLLIVYWTPLQNQVDLPSIFKIDFYITAGVGVVFLIASITFAATADSNVLAKVSVIFGFLATICFIIEVYIMWKNDRCPFKRKPTTTATNGTAESQPLNNPGPAQATSIPV